MSEMGRRVDSAGGVSVGSRNANDVVRVLVLGPLVVEHDGRALHVAGSHRRRLLAILASRAGRVVPVDVIIDALWGDDPPPTATRTIQSHVARLRRSFCAVDAAMIETAGGGYRLAVDASAIDANVFERMAEHGRRLLDAGEFAGAVTVLTEALALWRGAAYAEFTGADFAATEAIRLDELRWTATEDAAEARLESGALESVIPGLERLVAEQPGRERTWCLLMRALYAAGRQHDALVAFQRARRALADVFGLEPGPELRALERRVLEQDSGLSVRRRTSIPAELRRDQQPFVGRERELAWLAEGWRLARNGSGQLRTLFGPVDSGRTRLAAELAAVVVAEGGQVGYVHAAEGFDRLLGPERAATAPPGVIVDAMTARSRVAPLVVVVDDAEWANAATANAIATLAGAIEQCAVMLLVIADPSGSGPAVQALQRLDRSAGRTLVLDQMPDDVLAWMVTNDGVDGDGVAGVVAVADGLPGVARREAAAWAERAASDRLTAAAASSIGATLVADEARASVFDDVLALVAARARRDELVASSWVGRQPYRALSAYGPEDADLFVGRERLVAELVARVLDRRLVAVVGASGSGKSSLVRAGLVPLVRSGRLPGTAPWRTKVIVPGDDPLAALESVEAIDDPEPQLLVVDQFEELFSTGVVDAFAARLVDLVLDAALDVHIVLVVRSDQYAAFAAVRALAALVEDAQVVVGAPSEDELRRIIEVPARRTGCLVEAELVARVADAVHGYEAALPLVSAALADVWEGRRDDTMTVERYDQVGGLAAAVERLGARAVDQLGAVAPIHDVMVRLVDVTDEGQWVRRRVPTDDIPDDLSAAVDALVDARLVRRSDEEIDVVHEVVFRAWPLLAAWLDEARADLIVEHELRIAARKWDTTGRSHDDVYRGARLAAAAEFVARRDDVDDQIADFVAAGQRFAEREHEELRERLARETRARRRLGRALMAGAVLLIGALVAGSLAVVNQGRARDAERTAKIEALVGTSRGLLQTQRDVSALLAVEAFRQDDNPTTRSGLFSVFSGDPTYLDTHRLSDDLFEYQGIVMPDGETAFVTRLNEGIRPYDIDTGELGAPWPGSELAEGDYSILTASPDGSMLARQTFTPDRKLFVALYDTARQTLRIPLIEPPIRLGAVAFRADAKVIFVSGGEAGEVFGIDTTTGEQVLHLDGLPRPKDDPGYTADTAGLATLAGNRLAVGSLAGILRIVDAATMEELARVEEGFHVETTMELFPLAGGHELLAAGYDEVARIDADTGAIVWRESFEEQAPVICSPAFVVEQRDRLYCGGFTSKIQERSLADGSYLRTLNSQNGNPDALWPAHGASELVAFSRAEPVVSRWRLDGTGAVARRMAPGFNPVAYSPDGSMLLAVSSSGDVVSDDVDLIDTATGAVVDPLESFFAASFVDDRRMFGAAIVDGASMAVVKDLTTGTLAPTPVQFPDLPAAISIVPGSGRLFLAFQTADERYEIRTIDTATFERVEPTIEVDHLLSLAANQDGSRLVVAHDAGTLTMYDGLTGSMLASIKAEASFVFFTRADQLVTSSPSGRLVVRDAETLAPVVSLTGSQNRLDDVQSDTDGSLVAGASDSVALYSLPAGTTMGEPLQFGAEQRFMALRPDGLELATGGGTPGVGLQVWDLDPQHWVDAACRIAGRNLTEDEWSTYLAWSGSYHETCPGV
jgi:DNA-binding SARP family transcriptional activator/WD40 repeat protein